MSALLQITLILCYAYIAGLLATQISYKLFNDAFNKKSQLLLKPVCHKCYKPIFFFECLPILNLFIDGRKYKNCKHNIPATEIATISFLSINYVLAFFLFKNNNIQFLCFILLLFCLTTQALVDMRVMYSSDVIHLIELVLCMIMSVYCEKNDILQTILKMLGLFLFFVINIVIMQFILKKHTLGFGDIKLYLILSTLFSLIETMKFIALSGFCGVIFFLLTTITNKQKPTNKQENSKEFAFIPAILIAFLLAFYFKYFNK